MAMGDYGYLPLYQSPVSPYERQSPVGDGRGAGGGGGPVERPGDAILRLIMEQGRQRAESAHRMGELFGGAFTNLGGLASGYLQHRQAPTHRQRMMNSEIPEQITGALWG